MNRGELPRSPSRRGGGRTRGIERRRRREKRDASGNHRTHGRNPNTNRKYFPGKISTTNTASIPYAFGPPRPDYEAALSTGGRSRSKHLEGILDRVQSIQLLESPTSHKLECALHDPSVVISRGLPDDRAQTLDPVVPLIRQAPIQHLPLPGHALGCHPNALLPPIPEKARSLGARAPGPADLHRRNENNHKPLLGRRRNRGGSHTHVVLEDGIESGRYAEEHE
jgi:hypothetical protein